MHFTSSTRLKLLLAGTGSGISDLLAALSFLQALLERHSESPRVSHYLKYFDDHHLLTTASERLDRWAYLMDEAPEI